MRQLHRWESERSVLKEGLDTLSAAKEQFENRLEVVLEKLKLEQDPQHAVFKQEAAEERLMFDLQNVREINQRVKQLANGNGFPSVMGQRIDVQPQLAPPPPHPGWNQMIQQQQQMENQIQRLKEQNKMLTQEVNCATSFCLFPLTLFIFVS